MSLWVYTLVNTKNCSDIKDGAEIAIPNDPTNGARALRVLEKAGLLKLKVENLFLNLILQKTKRILK